MDIVAVLLLVLINANSTVSRNILSRRNTDLTKQINSAENDLTRINLPTPTDNKDNTEIGINMDFATQMTNKQDITEPTQPGLDSPHEKHENILSYNDASYEINGNIPGERNVAIEKQALRMTSYKYFEEIVTMSTFRTTSEDTLSWLLKQHLPFPHPAPDKVGQLNKDLMMPVTEPLWRFEDYDDDRSINKQIKDDATTCEAQRVSCVGDTEYNQPVCVWDLTIPEIDSINKHYRTKGFHSFCEVTYRNCLKRYELTGKNYADHYSEDYLEFYHYGWCHRCPLLIYCPSG
ncbi:uncharacterized protein LOC133529549 [Cydia pomonella]|uniref:uncharacterized protein LOC133529549 n=1 Tax=Cydia pomonella TaxID=82600 RepID=UPI002ADE3363|nr:uncharacterized protein LOC133529549 [Cydia pomonella]